LFARTQSSPHDSPRQHGRSAAGFKDLFRSLRYLSRYRRVALVAYLALFISTGAQLMVPDLVQKIIDSVTDGMTINMILGLPEGAQGQAADRMGVDLDINSAENAIISAGIAIVIFALTRGIFAFVQGYMAERLSQSIAFDLRNELFAKIQRLSFSYHDRNQTGQLMIRATDDVEKVRMFIGQGLLLALQAIVLLVGTLIILFTINVKLTLVALPVLPFALITFAFFGTIVQPLFTELQQRLSRMNTILQENLAGISVVKAFTRERSEQKRFRHAADDFLEQGLKVSRMFSLVFPIVFLIGNLGQAAVMYFGGRQIIGGTLTLGEWQEFSLYLVYVFFPLGHLGMIISLMSQAAASATRVYDILDTQNEVEDRPDAVEIGQVQGCVTFENVSFKYFKRGNYVLRDVSFEALPGQTIALLGATGSGKTTIINLLPRFYDASEGRVMIDDQDVRDVTLNSLRQQIGIVLQETTLFSGTIRDNIAFGRPDASIDEIIAAAQAAAAHEFIETFPDGYDTRVGERGTTLSGGQKQRIAIARALLMDPRILILDDSTSSVDLATEYRIQQALDQLMEGRTSFVIAQRISTVLNANQILVLDKGQIVAQGTHEDLIQNSPIYVEIYNSQLVADSDLDDKAITSVQQEVLS
jgi:ATP-binding cassette subfamily B multidrug efflux pump